MSEEKQKIEVGIGEKGEAPADAEITDLTKPEEDEVGGRCNLRTTTVVCPYCYAANRILEDPYNKLWFRCWNCAGVWQY